MEEVNYPPYKLIWVGYDVLKRVLESGRYDINKTHYTRVDGHDNRTLLSYWSYERVSIRKLKMILSFNPDKTHCRSKRTYSMYGSPLFHISSDLAYGFCNHERFIKGVDKACEKLKLILQDGYNYLFKDPITNSNLLQHYYGRVDDLYYNCLNWTEGIECTGQSCKYKKLYSSLAQVVQECWIKDVTLFDMMLNHCDISNKKQRT